MKVLLDECLHKQHTRELPGHFARTVPQMGWAGQKNGRLLRSMVEAGFQVFITVDKSLPFQQNLTNVPVVLVTLRASSNRYPDVAPLFPKILTALVNASPGDVIRLGLPESPAPHPAA